MTNILTATEAANALRTDEHDENMLALLPLVDQYILTATGHDWAADTAIHPAAKSAARMLLVKWHEDPGMIASGAALSYGLAAALAQLESLAGRYYEFQGSIGAGGIALNGARVGDTVSSVVGLIGVTGDQSSAFESVITVDDYIQQISTSDLSDNWYRALLTPISAL